MLEDEAADGSGGAGSGTGRALEDALGSLVGILNFAIRALGVLIPLAIMGGLAWLAFAALRRRRREAVLG
jgi:hypothetical protein